MKPIIILFWVSILSVALAQTPQSTVPNPETAVRNADAAWAKAVGSKSVDQTIAFYDPEAATAGSAMPPAQGLTALRAMWKEIFAQPGFALAWKLEKVVVTKSGTIAYSSGNWYETGSAASGGPYIAVWRKQPNGVWKVLIDSAWYAGKPK